MKGSRHSEEQIVRKVRETDRLPEVKRDRSALVIRLIAVERFARGVLVLVAGVYLLSHRHTNWEAKAYSLASRLDLDPEHGLVHRVLQRLHGFHAHQALLFGIAGVLYGLLELVEGGGLWLRRRWAEWLTVIATSLLVPFEIYELARKPSVLKAAGLAVNVLIVIYLARIVHRKGRRRTGP